MNEDLAKLVIVLAPISLAAFGGAASMYAPMQHQAVDVQHWATAREFIDMFAVSRVTPGPGSMLGTLLGWKIAGLVGAVVATLALYVPSSALVVMVGSVWNRHRGKTWHSALEIGLAPVGAGLLLAGVLTLARGLSEHLSSIVVILAVAGLMAWRSKLHPFVFLVGGGVACYLLYLAGG
ncbi:MAG: Chromate transport protein ChrA [Hyphomicrobiales bacterium]|jgi:chromate transporter|nr:Chromate transport protein ChrA [Hyphomicrobiales bacterium]